MHCFSIRDWVWLLTVLALAATLGWWLDHGRLQRNSLSWQFIATESHAGH
jgi:hypothetical protein